MNDVAKLRRQRSWVFVVTGAGIAAAMGVSLVFTPGEPAPVGLYLIIWAMAMVAGGGIILLGYAQAIRSATRLGHLTSISALSDALQGVNALISKLSEIAKDMYSLDIVAYQLYDESSKPGLLRLSPGVELAREYRSAIEEMMQGAANEALTSHAPVLLRMNDVSQIQRMALASLQGGSYLLLPLIWRNSLLGIVCAIGGSSHDLARYDSRFLSVLTKEVARSLRENLMLQWQEELRQEVNLYQEVSSAISQAADLCSILSSVVHWAGSRLQTDGAGVTLFDPGTGAVHAAAGEGLLESWSQQEDSIGAGEIIVRQSVSGRGETVRVNDVHTAPSGAPVNKEAAEGLGISRIIAVPLMSQEDVLGVIVAVRSSAKDAFTEEDESRLTAIASHAASGIATALLYIEERKRIAKLDQMASFKSGLVYNISHELRTSLAALKAATDLLIHEEGIEPGSEYFDRLMQSISRNVMRLEILVSNIVDMASLDNQSITLNPERLDVGDFVAETTSIVAPLFSKRSQTLSLSIPPDLPRIIADRQRLSQVLVNLLANAHKYAPEGSEISLSARSADDRLIFAVSDSGPGISPEERERVFDAFYRVQNSSDVGTPGSGLGLAIARSLVELHKGAIWVEDNPAGGAVLVVSLPIEGMNESPVN